MYVILTTITNRQRTDKQTESHKGQKRTTGTKGIRRQAQLNVVSETFDNTLNIRNDIRMELTKLWTYQS